MKYILISAHKLTAMNAHVDWENQKPEEIDAQFRALGESVSYSSTYLHFCY